MPQNSKFKIIKLAPENFLYKEGEVPKAMYLVKTGVISVFNQKKDKQLELVRIQAGHLVGELGFFKPEPFSSSAKALVETEVIEIPYQEVQKEFDAFPAWSRILLNTMSAQVIRFSRELKQFRVADNNEEERLLPLLKYLSAFNQAVDLYGQLSSGKLVTDRSSLRIVCTYLSQLALNKMDQFTTEMAQFGYLEKSGNSEDFQVRISEDQFQSFRRISKLLGLYLSSRPHLLAPSLENLHFIQALKTVGCQSEPNHKGVIRVQAAPILSELKRVQSKANMTTVDALIQLGISIEKSSGNDGIEMSFYKEDIFELAELWEFILRTQKASPL